jgi:hypothetical protein
MKIGDIIQIKSPTYYAVGAYHAHLFDEKLLVTDIIDHLECLFGGDVDHDPVVECVSESGIHRFPMEDVEVVDGNR